MAKKIISALGRFSNSTSIGNDDSYKQVNIAEYTVEKKKEGTYLLAQVLYIICFVAVLVAVIGVLYLVLQWFGILAGLALSGIGGWILWFFTHRYLEIEYSYAIEGAELICTEIYGNKSDKLLLRIKMSNIEKVVPYEGDFKKEIDGMKFDEKIFLLSTPTTDQAYCATYKTDEGKNGLVLFEACNKTLKAFKYYNSAGTVVKEMQR